MLFNKFRIFVLSVLLVFSLSTGRAQNGAKDWVMQDMAGQRQQLSQYKGRWLVVNYWAPWCPPCLEEMPELVTFYDAYTSKRVMILGVAVQYESVASVKKYVDDMLISYPVVLGDGQKSIVHKPEVLPTTYIYAPDGSLYQVKRGALSRTWLERLLKESAFGFPAKP